MAWRYLQPASTERPGQLCSMPCYGILGQVACVDAMLAKSLLLFRLVSSRLAHVGARRVNNCLA
jgi:hypothetical protein